MGRAAAVVGVVMLGLGGCHEASEDAGLSPSPIVVSSEEVDPGAASQNIVGEAHLLEPDRPLHHEDPATEWEAGTYRLIVSCAGNGDLRVGFRIGTVTAERNLRTCAPGGGFSAVDLRVDTASSGHAVDVSSIGNANGALAFAIRRR